MSKVTDQVSREVIDYCPSPCNSEIVFGQRVWKVGHVLCCSVPCMIQQAKVKSVIAGTEGTQYADTR
ncbi:hypothetical protein PAALTS15_13667 [Paenibacillus alvei TS-15]|uniref:Uncharacterized protein n=1 Tax=Paenibacillus alvei TS-15 TaxID=1117108 RepID=S9TWS8_PAEAL|nr:hypothetical protein [Paenibacillus alvei]EPY06656.1 hypothetical protein PAALTS15_13667 [Paenibacillus alvei TS-15]